MTPREFLDDIITPGVERLFSIGGPAVTIDANRMLLAIAQQESGPQLNARYQGSPGPQGPATGFWQFEQNGGVSGVLNHNSSKVIARAICDSCVVVATKEAVWRSIEGHDDLCVAFARLLLLTDPQPIPVTEQGGWDCYMRLWRPGKPHPETWPKNWSNASSAVLKADRG